MCVRVCVWDGKGVTDTYDGEHTHIMMEGEKREIYTAELYQTLTTNTFTNSSKYGSSWVTR